MLTWPDPSLPEEVRGALTGPGAPFEMREERVNGVELEVFCRRPTSLTDTLIAGAARFGDRPYVVFPDRALTFASILEPVAALAHMYRTEYGIGKGDRVAIAAANRLEYVLSFWAVTALGAVTVALNGWWTGPEMEHALQLTDPKLVLGDDGRLNRLVGSVARDLPVVSFDEDFDALEAAGAGASFPDVAIGEDDPYVILFTSGTTGPAKGALISHRSTIHFGLATQLRAAESVARLVASGHPAPDPYVPRSIAAAPMFHVAGLNCTLAQSPQTGLSIVYPPLGRWSEAVHLRLTQEHRATAWTLVPTQLWRLLDWPTLKDYDLSSLRTVGGGSAVWPPELLKRLEQQLPWARPGLGLGYGMTETNGLGTSLSQALTHSHPKSVGQSAPTVEVDVRDPETHTSLPEGHVGEIALRTAAAFTEYWGNPEATSAAVDSDGWYHTGDYGKIDDGCLYLEGRRQDLIIRGGENISPVEIENRLFEHPGIAEVAVVGVDHPTLGQEVKAYVVPRPSAELSEASVRDWCAEALSPFKVPSHVEFMAELPHNASGKVLKRLLGHSPPG